MDVKFLPGTQIELAGEDFLNIGHILDSVCMAGGLSLSQVSYLTGLAPHMVQNWVKRGFVSSPEKKRYSKKQFSRIATINFLKDSLKIETIVKLIGNINGRLNDESDDLIDDAELYTYFARIVFEIEADGLIFLGRLSGAIDKVLADYDEIKPGARRLLEKTLKIMAVAYSSARLKNSAENMIADLEIE